MSVLLGSFSRAAADSVTRRVVLEPQCVGAREESVFPCVLMQVPFLAVDDIEVSLVYIVPYVLQASTKKHMVNDD